MTLSIYSGVDDTRVLYTTMLESIVQALRGRCVVEGCKVTAGLGLSVKVASGVVEYNGVEYNVPATTVNLAGAEADKDRVDVIVWDYNGGNPVVKAITGIRWINDNGVLRPLSERITDEQIPLAIVIVRAGATSIIPTDVIDVRTVRDSGGIVLKGDLDVNGYVIKNIGGMMLKGSITPSVDNVYSLGSKTARMANVYAVNVYVGDVKLENGWIITEYEDGKLINGVRILNSKREEIFKVTEDGLWFKGKKIA